MDTVVKWVLALFSLVFIINTHWIYWPVIIIGAVTVYIGYMYVEADDLQRQNIKAWLDELPHVLERLFI